jgi:hypothetical protein
METIKTELNPSTTYILPAKFVLLLGAYLALPGPEASLPYPTTHPSLKLHIPQASLETDH